MGRNRPKEPTVGFMSNQISVLPLHRGRIAECYPLAGLALRHCAPEAWETYARRHIELRGGPATGIFIAEDQLGTILGLLVYQIAERNRLERAFQVKTLIAAGPFASGRAKVAQSLVSAEEQAATATGCCSAEVFPPVERGPRETDWWIALLMTRGYQQRGPMLAKPLPVL